MVERVSWLLSKVRSFDSKRLQPLTLCLQGSGNTKTTIPRSYLLWSNCKVKGLPKKDINVYPYTSCKEMLGGKRFDICQLLKFKGKEQTKTQGFVQESLPETRPCNPLHGYLCWKSAGKCTITSTMLLRSMDVSESRPPSNPPSRTFPARGVTTPSAVILIKAVGWERNEFVIVTHEGPLESAASQTGLFGSAASVVNTPLSVTRRTALFEWSATTGAWNTQSAQVVHRMKTINHFWMLFSTFTMCRCVVSCCLRTVPEH